MGYRRNALPLSHIAWSRSQKTQKLGPGITLTFFHSYVWCMIVAVGWGLQVLSVIFPSGLAWVFSQNSVLVPKASFPRENHVDRLLVLLPSFISHIASILLHSIAQSNHMPPPRYKVKK